MKRKVKKKKIKKKSIFILILFLLILSGLIYLLTLVPIKGYYIKGNTYYSDQEILQMTGLDKYPSYLFTNSFTVSDKVKKDKVIKNIKIKKNLSFEFEVIVNEKKILCYDQNKKKSILEDGIVINYYDEDIPLLINEINNERVYKKFLKKMIKIDDNIMNIMSEIKYSPNGIDKERFLVSMNDGNYVYLTLSKFTQINDYLKISKTLQNKNGILYLDYGNYFLSQ